jgi:hypothetical protein
LFNFVELMRPNRTRLVNGTYWLDAIEEILSLPQ